MLTPLSISSFFFFNDTATTEIYTLSLHDALPISLQTIGAPISPRTMLGAPQPSLLDLGGTPSPEKLADRKSTRLNSSHQIISYAVFCLKKKNNTNNIWPVSTTRWRHTCTAHTDTR